MAEVEAAAAPGPALTLTPFSAAHFAALASWFASERDVVQWGGPSLSYPLRRADMVQMLKDARRSPPLRHCWTAQLDDRPVGHAQLAYDWRNGNATLGRVAVAPDQRGRGLARVLLAPVIDFAFSQPEIARLELHVFPWNTAAMRSYARLGFVHEGVRRSSARVGAERWDTAIMALLRAEWQARSGLDAQV